MNKINITAFNAIELKEDNTSEFEALRVGTIQDRGLKITEQMLNDFVKNFKDNVYGTELQVNLNHDRGSDSAGWIKDLYIKGQSLMAVVEWTKLGVSKIQNKLYKFVSSELAFEYPHHLTGKPVKNVFIGCALTNTPALKSQAPLTLEELQKLKNNKLNNMLKKLLEELKKRDKISQADKDLALSLLEEVEDEKEKEEAKKEIEEMPVEEEKEEEKTEEKEEEKKEELNEQVVSLKEYNRLKAKVELRDLTDQVKKEIVLSEKVSVGLNDQDAGKAAKFMVGLSEDQRQAFLEIMKSVKHVEFKTLGSSDTAKVDNSQDLEERVMEKAQELMEKDPNLSIIDAQERAFNLLSK